MRAVRRLCLTNWLGVHYRPPVRTLRNGATPSGYSNLARRRPFSTSHRSPGGGLNRGCRLRHCDELGYHTEMTRRFAVWNEVTGLTAAA